MEAESDAEAEALLGPEEKAEAIKKLPNFLPNLPNFLPQLFCLLLCLLFLPQLFLVPPTHVNKALIMHLKRIFQKTNLQNNVIPFSYF